ncbi:uncharacterized protein LOC134197364 [Corticium candelabrum]|uniref:uncharacterized protein LOC134197364 n=1 Tax=Corticium candelabrum TaxID=121492 RepID=UPI002E26973C|nr:uncharacterized protein LOC134197364 [Corticium candelabrum]
MKKAIACFELAASNLETWLSNWSLCICRYGLFSGFREEFRVTCARWETRRKFRLCELIVDVVQLTLRIQLNHLLSSLEYLVAPRLRFLEGFSMSSWSQGKCYMFTMTNRNIEMYLL